MSKKRLENRIIVSWDEESGTPIHSLRQQLKDLDGYCNIVHKGEEFIMVRSDEWLDQQQALKVMEESLGYLPKDDQIPNMPTKDELSVALRHQAKEKREENLKRLLARFVELKVKDILDQLEREDRVELYDLEEWMLQILKLGAKIK